MDLYVAIFDMNVVYTVFHSRSMVTIKTCVFVYSTQSSEVTFICIKIAQLNYSHLVTTILQQQHKCELLQHYSLKYDHVCCWYGNCSVVIKVSSHSLYSTCIV